MTNNDILRRLRYALNVDDAALVAVFARGGRTVTEAEVRGLMGREFEPGTIECDDATLELFLDGLVLERRGPPPAHLPPPKPAPFSNNAILKKLRVALSLRDVDVIEIVRLGGRDLTKGELGALSRPPGHRNFRPCGNQLLRAFLKGIAERNQRGSQSARR